MKRVNFRTVTLLFFALLLTLNLFNLFGTPTQGSIAAFLDDHRAMLYLTLAGAYLIFPIILAFFPCSQFHYRPVICSGNSTGKEVAITFDDGPDATVTQEILDVLQRFEAPAAFFLIGKNIPGNEELVKRMVLEGHTLGNHSHSHAYLWDLWMPASIRRDIERAEEEIFSVTGLRTRFFRPPYGVINPMVTWALEKLHYHVIAWNVRSFDTTSSHPEQLLRRIIQRVKPGSVIVLHDTRQISAGILSGLIVSLREQGYTITPLPRLINRSAYA